METGLFEKDCGDAVVPKTYGENNENIASADVPVNAAASALVRV